MDMTALSTARLILSKPYIPANVSPDGVLSWAILMGGLIGMRYTHSIFSMLIS